MSLQHHSAPIVLDQSPSLKSFSLADVLSLASGLRLGQADVHGLISFITERPRTLATTAAHSHEARACLLAQHPFLKDIHYGPALTAFRAHPEKLEEHLEIWYQSLQRRFGNTFHVMPWSRWNRRRNSHKL